MVLGVSEGDRQLPEPYVPAPPVPVFYRGASAIREKTLQELRKYFREDKFVELTLVICMGNLTNRFNEALKISPDLG